MSIRRLFCTTALLAALLATSAAHAAGANGGKPLTAEEAAVLLKQLSAELDVVSVKPAPVEGLWEVVVKARGQMNILYVDSSKTHVFVGALINVPLRQDLTRAALDELRKINVAEIPLEDAIVMGKKDAKHKVIVFDDPD